MVAQRPEKAAALHEERGRLEHGLGVAHAEGLHKLQFPQEDLVGSGAEVQHVVHHLHGGHGLGAEGVAHHGKEFPLEFAKARRGHAHACGHAMPAVAFQRVGAGGKASVQVELADGAARALEAGPVAAEHEHGLMVLLHKAGSHDADDALIPVLPGDDQRGFGLLGLGLHEGLFGDAFLFGAALGVEGVQFAGKVGGFVEGAGAQEGEGRFGRGHAACGVDARRKAEHHLPRPKAGKGREAAHGLEFGDARALGLGNDEQAVLHKDAVLPFQLHKVGQRAKGHKVEHAAHIHFRRAAFGKAGVQFAHQQEGHAHAGKALAGAVRQLGIAEHVRTGQFFRRQVMVGNDHGHAQLAGAGYGRPVGDAAVHGEQELRALGVQRFHALGVHAVAFLAAVGQMPEAAEAVMFQHFQNDGGAGHAVGVVVAPHGQLLPGAQAFGQYAGGFLHAGPFLGPGQIFEARIQIFLKLGGLVEAAKPEQTRQLERDAKAVRKGVEVRRQVFRAVFSRPEYPVLCHRYLLFAANGPGKLGLE